MSGEEERQVRNILLLSREKVIKSEFFYSLVTEIQQNVEAKGCVLMLHTLQDEDIEQGQIPVAVRNHQADGIVCMEIFSKEYIEELLSYGVPTIFFEFYYDLWAIPGKYDVVMMNNEQPVYELTSRMLERGCRNVGFVGDFMHCRGFYERYQGYCRALTEHGIPLEKSIV